MLVKLHYTETIQHQTSAAFIRGKSPEVWLKELNRWDISFHQLECYLVPESLQSLQPAGLFVIFNKMDEQHLPDLMEPYGMIAESLYVPVGATLTPQVRADEWQELLLWERQLFHPTIGLIGFSLSDRLNLTELLDFEQPVENTWKLSRQGIPPRHKLQQIQVQQPSLEDVMASFKELIDTKSLEQIMNKEDENSSLIRDLFNNLQQGSLKTALSALQKIKDTWPQANKDAKSSTGNNPGLFDRLENWIKENLNDLEKKRDNEIKRLLNLFDENTDEALKYAIPLDSPYLNRGTPAPSARLGEHSTDFDLGKLGGGQQTDSWNVQGYYHDLRNKYQKAAQKEIEAKDFKKAAYIYAHLLGDFHSAANVLEQGKHYREAAVLYKDHLNNLSAAAACLERGGLLLEAIELYDKLYKYEKVGDLYQKMEQAENAARYYEQSVASLLINKDYLDASRIIGEKLNDSNRAMQTLFNGWTDSNQSEACLKQYLSLLYENNTDEVSTQLEEIFEHHTPKSRQPQLLHVLTYINEGKNDPELLDTSRNIAYQIISEELEEGKLSHVHTLQKFFPEDPLLSSDSSRFASKAKVQPVQTPAATSAFGLDTSIRWVHAVAHRNQFLALGIKNAKLHLARGNWYGNVEYYSWSFEKATGSFALITDPLRSNHVLLYSSAGITLEEKTLPRNKYFDEELIIQSPAFLSKGIMGMSFNSQGGITALAINQHKLSLHQYSIDNRLQQTIDCTLDSESSLLATQLSEMIYRNGFYYSYVDTYFLKIGEDGMFQSIDVNAQILLFAASTQYAKFRIVLSTDNGCILLRQVSGELKAGSTFFAQDIEPIDIKFMSANNLIIASKHKIAVYDISEDSVRVLHTIDTQSPVVALLPTSNRKQFAYLDEIGKVFTASIDLE